MKIQCPKCRSVFQVDAHLLQSSENRFRCYKCGYMWILDISKYNKTRDFHDIDHLKTISKVPGKPKDIHIFDSVFFIILSAILLFIVISFLIISNRTSIVKGLKRLSLPSINSKTISRTELELEIDIPIPTIRISDKDFLIIKGKVINRTSKSQQVPLILIDLKNREKNILWHLSRKFHKSYILPNSSEDFTFSVEKYSKNITNVNVSFDTQSK